MKKKKQQQRYGIFKKNSYCAIMVLDSFEEARNILAKRAEMEKVCEVREIWD